MDFGPIGCDSLLPMHLVEEERPHNGYGDGLLQHPEAGRGRFGNQSDERAPCLLHEPGRIRARGAVRGGRELDDHAVC